MRKARSGGGGWQPGTTLAPVPRQIMRRLLTALLILIPAACDDAGSERVPRDAPPAAAVLAPGREAARLDAQLADLEAEVGRALAGEPERLLTAEAITDGLLHADRPVDWLGTGYDVEARLRQIQSLADRLVALLRRGAALENVEADIETLRASVRDLREQLARPGGGSAPPTLDSLLAQDPLRDVSAPSMRGVVDATDTTGTDTLPPIEPRIEPARGLLGSPVGGARDTIPGRPRP